MADCTRLYTLQVPYGGSTVVGRLIALLIAKVLYKGFHPFVLREAQRAIGICSSLHESSDLHRLPILSPTEHRGFTDRREHFKILADFD